MKLLFNDGGITMIPEDDRDWSYFETVLGLRKDGDRAVMRRQPGGAVVEPEPAAAAGGQATVAVPVARPTSPPARQHALRLGVDDLALSVRAERILRSANIRRIFELVCMSESDLLMINGCGRYTLREIKSKLPKAGLGLWLGTDPATLPADLRDSVAARKRGRCYTDGGNGG